MTSQEESCLVFSGLVSLHVEPDDSGAWGLVGLQRQLHICPRRQGELHICTEPPHHQYHQYRYCHPNQNIPQVGWWLEQSVPGQVLLPLVQEQCHRVSTINMIFINKTLPKAQRTRGLSSYHKFKHKSWSNFIFKILTKHQLQNINQASTSKSRTNNSISIKL